MSDHIGNTNKMIPWANEPTPITDDVKQTVQCNGDYFNAVGSELPRNLERRMRAAERLLDHALEHCGRSFTAQNIKVHLEAARKEDGR